MAKPDYSAALAKQIERDDIVVQVAKIIDPGAFAVWYRGTAPDKKPVPPDTRKRLAQATAICKAIDALKLASAADNLKKQLADSEATAWEDLGVPANDPDLRRVVDLKYA